MKELKMCNPYSYFTLCVFVLIVACNRTNNPDSLASLKAEIERKGSRIQDQELQIDKLKDSINNLNARITSAESISNFNDEKTPVLRSEISRVPEGFEKFLGEWGLGDGGVSSISYKEKYFYFDEMSEGTITSLKGLPSNGNIVLADGNVLSVSINTLFCPGRGGVVGYRVGSREYTERTNKFK